MIKRLMEKFEAAMAAVAFAEEGEADAARRIMADAGMSAKVEPRHDQADSPSRFPKRVSVAGRP